MSIDTKIYLNSHAHPRKILDVIQKVVGAEFSQETFSKEKNKIDFSMPGSDINSWHVKFKKTPGTNIELSDPDYFTLHFQDVCNNTYRTLLHLHIEDDDKVLNNEVLMSPNSTPIWQAIGKRLVNFFGGKLFYNDSADFDDPSKWYINENGKYPPKKLGQTGNDRWFQYHNLLFLEPILTKKEILECFLTSSYSDEERTDSLLNYLEKLESFNSLSKDLKNKPTTNKTNRKKV